MANRFRTNAPLSLYGRIVAANTPDILLEDEDVKEFYLGIRSEESVKGYQRWKKKKRWR
jgi:branched-chain amino acid transport system ATP-binding protein